MNTKEIKLELKAYKHIYYQPCNRRNNGKPTSEAFNEIYLKHIRPLEKQLSEILIQEKQQL